MIEKIFPLRKQKLPLPTKDTQYVQDRSETNKSTLSDPTLDPHNFDRSYKANDENIFFVDKESKQHEVIFRYFWKY